MIEDKLYKLGLTDNEVLVYLAVLKHSIITPSEIAKQTGLSRPTVYTIGKKLSANGYVLEEDDKATLHLRALPTDSVIKKAKREKEEAEERLKLAQSLVPELDLLPKSKEYSIPKARFIDESRLVEYIYKQADDWDQSALSRDATWWGIQDSSLVKELNEWLTWYWKRADPMIQTKIITNKKEEGYSFPGQETFRRKLKHWSNTGSIRTTQMIIGDYILIVNTHKKPFSLFEICDAVTAEGLRQVFRKIWDTI